MRCYLYACHLIQREVDAVNQWINQSNYAGHIMRGIKNYKYIYKYPSFCVKS